MAYKPHPWHCTVCNRNFMGALGKASHYRSKAHKANVILYQESK